MAYEGYFTYDSVEIINSARTQAYARVLPPFRPVYLDDDLGEALGETYSTPAADNAPWYDPDRPESGDFYGAYPLSVSGLEDSSRGSEVVESLGEGGTPGRVRHGVKSAVFTVVLLGGSERATNYGLEWLRRALLGRVCGTDLTTAQGLGLEMTYLAAPPKVSDDPTQGAAATLTYLTRRLQRVTINSGPSVTARLPLSCGGSAWTVTFTAVAGLPTEMSLPVALLQGLFEQVDPWVPGVTPGSVTEAVTYTEEVFGDPTWQPVFDPTCPALIVPPTPPAVPLSCWEIPTTWNRRQVTIPAPYVPLWGGMSPIVNLYAPTDSEVRDVRLRWFRDDNEDGLIADERANIGEAVVSYIPAGGVMTIDGPRNEVMVYQPTNGQRRRADSLVFSTDSTPYRWPLLSCGVQHILVVDYVTTAPSIDLSLVAQAI